MADYLRPRLNIPARYRNAYDAGRKAFLRGQTINLFIAPRLAANWQMGWNAEARDLTTSS